MTNELVKLVREVKGPSKAVLAVMIEKINNLEERLKVTEEYAKEIKMSLDQFRKGIGQSVATDPSGRVGGPSGFSIG